MAVPDSHAYSHEGETNGVRIAAELVPDFGQGLTGGIKHARLFDLSGGKGTVASRDSLPFKE